MPLFSDAIISLATFRARVSLPGDRDVPRSRPSHPQPSSTLAPFHAPGFEALLSRPTIRILVAPSPRTGLRSGTQAERTLPFALRRNSNHTISHLIALLFIFIEESIVQILLRTFMITFSVFSLVEQRKQLTSNPA